MSQKIFVSVFSTMRLFSQVWKEREAQDTRLWAPGLWGMGLSIFSSKKLDRVWMTVTWPALPQPPYLNEQVREADDQLCKNLLTTFLCPQTIFVQPFPLLSAVSKVVPQFLLSSPLTWMIWTCVFNVVELPSHVQWKIQTFFERYVLTVCISQVKVCAKKYRLQMVPFPLTPNGSNSAIRGYIVCFFCLLAGTFSSL